MGGKSLSDYDQNRGHSATFVAGGSSVSVGSKLSMNKPLSTIHQATNPYRANYFSYVNSEVNSDQSNILEGESVKVASTTTLTNVPSKVEEVQMLNNPVDARRTPTVRKNNLI